MCKRELWKAKHPDYVVRILIAEYLTARKSHVVLDDIKTPTPDTTLR